MPDQFPPLLAHPAPTPDRPLAGVTVLVVEDSRFASEAVRLLCLRSGARIRRADSLRTAERHLATYRPNAVLIDLGLPDGSGIDLIRRLAKAAPRLPAILATSGEESLREEALAAGADAFLAKPIASLASFQAALAGALGLSSAGPRPVSAERIEPDPLAYRDDLTAIADLLAGEGAARSLGYAAQFLSGIARSAEDAPLAEAAAALSAHEAEGAPVEGDLARIAALVHERLARPESGESLGRRIA
jgi:CheY-like chemotaxis protein